ncbi:hypothetical protein ACFVWY_25445 [Streptomyces sp. NPDC058195]|uniref:hypothetical protein n=1 Tax=Streptomyces sp. NPDC058195 TaxID=3346375 RepID=UPI0036E12A70
MQRAPLPVVPESATAAPLGPEAAPGSVPPGPSALAVRVPRRTPATLPATTPAPAPRPGTRASAHTADVLQRAAADAGITGVPVRAVQAKPAAAPGHTGPAAPAEAATADTPAHRITGADIEELARRLIDPVSRLIRADLRRGRERTGRLYDGRR